MGGNIRYSLFIFTHSVTTSGHEWKLKENISGIDLRECFLKQCLIILWVLLPENSIEGKSLVRFSGEIFRYK